MRRSVSVMLLGTMVGLSGCQSNKTRMTYNPDAWRIVPVVSPGDTVEWVSDLAIAWDNNDDPCVVGSSPCQIRKDLTGKLYSYTCKKFDCDPEIAVDDQGGVVKRLAVEVPPPRPTHLIKIACVNGTTAIVDTEVHTGETIGWGAYGSGVQDGWNVKIDKQADLCKETVGPIQGQMICTVKAAPPSSFTYSVTDACPNQPATAPKINVTER